MLKYSYTLNVKSDYASLTYHFPQIMIVILIICTKLFVGLIFGSSENMYKYTVRMIDSRTLIFCLGRLAVKIS